MARWMIALVAVFVVAFGVTVLISGDAVYLIPMAILVALVIGYAVLERGMTRHQLARHGGDAQAAAADADDPIPSTHLIGDDATPAGDSPELHDEISPHDLPPDHPGRHAVEEQAGATGTTSGNERGAQGGRFERRPDRTEERTGERQRSAEKAKSPAGGSGPRTGTGRGEGDGGARQGRPGQEFPL